MKGAYVRHPSSAKHDTGAHPENASRLRAIESALEKENWLGLDRIEAPAASREQLELVHTRSHIDAIEELSARGGGMVDMDTVASPGSFDAALHAAGGSVIAVDSLIGGELEFAFCGLRPPGHHAERARAMGFCLFNNVAVAAAHALTEHGLQRVLVIDWDVHHGNGTESIFYDSDRVLYASIHESPLYPGTGGLGDTGAGAGRGYTLNLPVPPGAGREDFLSRLDEEIVPAAREASPELIAVSAGYDAHRDDPLADCRLTEDDYAAMTSTVAGLSEELGAPILICLEGGYNLDALAASVSATLETLAKR